ncbi:ATP-binding cassette domain-containing protein [Nonomuraea sp. NPDC055795]
MDLSNVSFRYRRRAPDVIRNADTVLNPGDVIELTGANGAGKSTLLRLLAGLTHPTSGKISARPRTVGYAPDHLPTAQPFTVSAYLDHMARIRGGATWRPWADRLNLTHLVRLPLRELSKGSAHKVALIQALMCQPGLLLLDEPFAGLDTDTREALPAIVTEVAARGTIVVAGDHEAGLHGLPSLRHWTLTDGILQEPSPLPESATAQPPVITTATASQPTPPNQQHAPTPNHKPHPTPNHKPHPTPDHAPHSTPDHAPHLTPDHEPHLTSNHASGHTPDLLADHTLDRTPDQTPDLAPDHASGPGQHHTSSHAPDLLADHTLGGTPDQTPGLAPDHAPDLGRSAALSRRAALSGQAASSGRTEASGQAAASDRAALAVPAVGLASGVDVGLAVGVERPAEAGRLGGLEGGVVVEVRVPDGEVGSFLARMRAEGYEATEAAQ